MDFRRATGRHQPRMLALCRGTGYPAGNLQPLSCSWFTLVKPGKKELAELDMEKKEPFPRSYLTAPKRNHGGCREIPTGTIYGVFNVRVMGLIRNP